MYSVHQHISNKYNVRQFFTVKHQVFALENKTLPARLNFYCETAKFPPRKQNNTFVFFNRENAQLHQRKRSQYSPSPSPTIPFVFSSLRSGDYFCLHFNFCYFYDN